MNKNAPKIIETGQKNDPYLDFIFMIYHTSKSAHFRTIVNVILILYNKQDVNIKWITY